MQTLICPTCGCSLVRLGITRDKAVRRHYNDIEYLFCCDGCAKVFDKDPVAALNETNDLVICPSCLAEKPIDQTVVLTFKGETIYFCKCPYCMTVFKENAEYYIKRLSGEIAFSGVFSDSQGCCG